MLTTEDVAELLFKPYESLRNVTPDKIEDPQLASLWAYAIEFLYELDDKIDDIWEYITSLEPRGN